MPSTLVVTNSEAPSSIDFSTCDSAAALTITSTPSTSSATSVCVADVAVHEREPLVAHHVGEVLQVAGVGERVERDHLVAVCASRWRITFEEMNPAPPVTRTRFTCSTSSALDRVQRPALDLALDAAEVLADEREDEPLHAEHEDHGPPRKSGPGKFDSAIQYDDA